MTTVTHLWDQLLKEEMPVELYGGLKGLADTGAALEWDQTAERYRITPPAFDPPGSEWGEGDPPLNGWTAASYEEVRKQYLMPYRDQITALLQKLSPALPSPETEMDIFQ